MTENKDNFLNIEKARFETFIDAILAIIMTIMVLDIRLPETALLSEENLRDELLKSFTPLLGFIISFFTIVTMWIDHHDLLRSMKKVTKEFVVLNFILVAITATLPFTTTIAWNNPHSPSAVFAYAVNILLINLFIVILFVFGIKFRLLDEKFLQSKFMKVKGIFGFVGIMFTIASLPLAFVNPSISLFIAGLIPFSHITLILFTRKFKS